jgi:hypothetical protein
VKEGVLLGWGHGAAPAISLRPGLVTGFKLPWYLASVFLDIYPALNTATGGHSLDT